jgi:hypothetical protein
MSPNSVQPLDLFRELIDENDLEPRERELLNSWATEQTFQLPEVPQFELDHITQLILVRTDNGIITRIRKALNGFKSRWLLIAVLATAAAGGGAVATGALARAITHAEQALGITHPQPASPEKSKATSGTTDNLSPRSGNSNRSSTYQSPSSNRQGETTSERAIELPHPSSNLPEQARSDVNKALGTGSSESAARLDTTAQSNEHTTPAIDPGNTLTGSIPTEGTASSSQGNKDSTLGPDSGSTNPPASTTAPSNGNDSADSSGSSHDS